MMLVLKIYGSPECRRYQRMRKNVLQALTQLEGEFRLEEINDAPRLSRHNPLDYPLLVADGQVIACRNPPKVEQILSILYALETQ